MKDSMDMLELIGDLDDGLLIHNLKASSEVSSLNRVHRKQVALTSCICMIALGILLFAWLFYSSYSNPFVIEDHVLISYRGTERTVVIPDNVHTIANYAFRNGGHADTVEHIILGEQVGTVELYALDSCVNLKKITISEYNNTLQQNCNEILSEDGKQLIYLNAVTEGTYKVSDGVERIGSYALYASGVTELILPESVTALNPLAVLFNDHLEKVVLLGVTHISNQAFYQNVTLRSVCAPVATLVGESAFSGCRFLSEVEIPLVERIESNAFYNCERLNELSFAQLTSVGNNAFYGCVSLKQFDAPGLIEVGAGFLNRTQVRAIRLPQVQALDTWTFDHAMALWGYPGGAAENLVQVLQFEPELIQHMFIDMREHELPDNYLITYECVVVSEEYTELLDTLENTAECILIQNGETLVCLAIAEEWSIVLLNEKWYYTPTANLTFSVDKPVPNEYKLYGNFQYEELEDEIRILRYLGSGKIIEIPECIYGKRVTEIAEDALLNDSYTSVELLSIPGIRHLPSRLVQGMSSLQQFSAPLLEELPDRFFYNCGNLESVNLPSVKRVGKEVFQNCRFTEWYIVCAIEIHPQALNGSCVKTLHGKAGSYVEQWAHQNGYGFVDIDYDYIPEYPPEIFDPAELDYFEITTGDLQYGGSGISVAYDRYRQMYIYVESWRIYRTLPLFGIRERHHIAATIFGENGWIITAANNSSGYTRTLNVSMVRKDTPEALVSTIDLGTDKALFGIFCNFYDEEHGSIFLCHSEFSWRITVFQTSDGGMTWQEQESGTDVVANNWHESPILAKVLNQAVGIIAYRYCGGEDYRQRTYITQDGGKTWVLANGLPEITGAYGTEAVDLQYVKGVYILVIKCYDGNGGFYNTYQSSNLLTWQKVK